MKDKIQIFENNIIRSVWDDEKEEWYFSVIDVCAVLSQSTNPKRYWSDLKRKLKQEGASETYEKIVRLRMTSEDGAHRQTDATTISGILRIIQSIPSPKAEPIKQWLAKVGTARIDEDIDPQIAIDRARATFKAKGYSDAWIKTRLQGIQARHALTDEWRARGVKDDQYAILTNIIHSATFDLSVKQHKQIKGLKKENLRDNMTPVEMALTTLAEVSTTEISKTRKPESLDENQAVAREGGDIAKRARLDIEKKTGRKVVSAQNAKDMLEAQKQVDVLEGTAEEKVK
ncbi:MAG TPA: hypothetical protein DEO49_04330 [Sutterella sp.]|nr:hypothetical protein [Sutterella sp.]